MKKKITQREIVERKLKEDGFVSRNWCLQQFITRLGAIICTLQQEGWELSAGYEATPTGQDYVYRVTKSLYRKVEYHVPALNRTIIKYERITNDQN